MLDLRGVRRERGVAVGELLMAVGEQRLAVRGFALLVAELLIPLLDLPALIVERLVLLLDLAALIRELQILLIEPALLLRDLRVAVGDLPLALDAPLIVLGDLPAVLRQALVAVGELLVLLGQALVALGDLPAMLAQALVAVGELPVLLGQALITIRELPAVMRQSLVALGELLLALGDGNLQALDRCERITLGLLALRERAPHLLELRCSVLGTLLEFREPRAQLLTLVVHLGRAAAIAVRALPRRLEIGGKCRDVRVALREAIAHLLLALTKLGANLLHLGGQLRETVLARSHRRTHALEIVLRLVAHALLVIELRACLRELRFELGTRAVSFREGLVDRRHLLAQCLDLSLNLERSTAVRGRGFLRPAELVELGLQLGEPAVSFVELAVEVFGLGGARKRRTGSGKRVGRRAGLGPRRRAVQFLDERIALEDLAAQRREPGFVVLGFGVDVLGLGPPEVDLFLGELFGA